MHNNREEHSNHRQEQVKQNLDLIKHFTYKNDKVIELRRSDNG